MKKLLLVLLCVPLIGFGQIKSIDSILYIYETPFSDSVIITTYIEKGSSYVGILRYSDKKEITK